MNENTNILTILDNINYLTSFYNNTAEINEEHLLKIKNTKLVFNNITYSFFYLMNKPFFFINENEIKIKIIFRIKILDDNLIYKFNLKILTGEGRCNSFKCNELLCRNGMHYFEKSNDIKYTYETKNPDDIVFNIEQKLNDFNKCNICFKTWDMNTNDRVPQIDMEKTDICDNCNIFNHFNNKIMKSVGECAICLKIMYTNNTVKTNCDHVFHEACLENWLKTKHNCPLCRNGFL